MLIEKGLGEGGRGEFGWFKRWFIIKRTIVTKIFENMIGFEFNFYL